MVRTLDVYFLSLEKGLAKEAALKGKKGKDVGRDGNTRNTRTDAS